ncbi:putative flavin-containing monooxygenase 1 [Curcuma longa]|uniref:putative flavin-containing monooxygenase 1 n=1 Tax=Curcuma longa TaxID=136217 RepID=UPI003D9E46C2
MEKKRVGIVGAGISGLAACKHAAERGFRPVVFEASAGVGGLWAHTPASTKLQSPALDFTFSDFPWPPDATEIFPRHDQVMNYLESYARHFDLLRWIKFHSSVVSIDLVGTSEEEIAAWDLWAGNGEAFGGGAKGEWHLTVQHKGDPSTEIYRVDFLILCIGRFSDVPNFPNFAPWGAAQVFDGMTMHSMEYSNMDDAAAAALVRGKRVTVVGSGKTAFEIASECADANGVGLPCTMILQTKRWFIGESAAMRFRLFGHFYRTRFAELLVHKPGEGLFLSLLATFLAPLRWLFNKITERHFTRNMPLMKKHGMVPDHSFFQGYSSCVIGMLPEKFYERVEEGIITLKRPTTFAFCKDGLVIDKGEVVHSDLVIFATGFKGDQKLRNIFVSKWFQQIVAGSATPMAPLYRECIHPRIPQLAIVGFAESFSDLHAADMRSKWISHFLDGQFRLPSISSMEKSVTEWQKYFRKNILELEKHTTRTNREFFRGSCIGAINIWYNDLLCRDMGYNTRRKKGLLAEWFQQYNPVDYAGLYSGR